MAKRLKLNGKEAEVILRTNEHNVDATTKRLLQKVVDKRPLSEEEIGEIEGIIINHRLNAKVEHGDFEDDPQLPIDPGSLIEIEAEKKRRMARARIEARRKLVFEMRCMHPPKTVRQIAEKLNVALDTVFTDIESIRKKHEQVMGSNPMDTLAMLGSTVEQFDILHGKAMALADQYTSPMAKAAFLRTAISALDSKSKLMADTGIIQRVPQRQEILVAHADAGSVRERVAKLVKAQNERGDSPTLELPPVREDRSTAADEEITEADLVETDNAQPTPAP